LHFAWLSVVVGYQNFDFFNDCRTAE
jgi:hypothetical protein